MGLNVLFIGGTGQISLPCVIDAVEKGHRVTIFNRGKTNEQLPAGVETIAGEMGSEAYADLARRKFDVVCQFIVFKPEELDQDLKFFAGHCGQYVFISSASVYEKPARHYVITEETPASNPYWAYSQAKIACEDRLHGSSGLDWTIVRPSHTVRTGLPIMIGDATVMARRMLEGRPTIVAGDGKTPWTLTRSEDFATPFVRLFGKSKACRDVFHITGDRAFIWDEIQTAIAAELRADAGIVHVPTDTLIRFVPEWEGPLLGDKTWTAIFDNSKIKSVVGDFHCSDTLAEILAEPIRHMKRELRENPPPESHFDRLVDSICTAQAKIG